eukprot:Skav200536  [mRNA]  locus=scaffold676:44826:48561:+ [translate_table: standard]
MRAERGSQAPEDAENLVAKIVDEGGADMFQRIPSSEQGCVRVRLQCWDFPGQEEYALLNQLYFSESAIYLVFLDLTGDIEQEWRHISFWLWAIAKFSIERKSVPPIFLLGTHAGAPPERKLNESELHNRLENLQQKIPHLKKQLQARPANFVPSSCEWLILVENKANPDAQWITDLRRHLQRTALQLVVEDAMPGHRSEVTSDLLAISEKDEVTVPEGAFIELENQDEESQEDFDFDVSCDFLELSVVKRILALPRIGLSDEDAEEVLILLDRSGILVWINEPDLRDLVMLNPRRLAVAMANLMTLCFGVDNFQHQDTDKIQNMEHLKKLNKNASDLQRFRSTGIATQAIIEGIWNKEAGWQLLAMVFAK